jgi:hypothetical protein
VINEGKATFFRCPVLNIAGNQDFFIARINYFLPALPLLSRAGGVHKMQVDLTLAYGIAE